MQVPNVMPELQMGIGSLLAHKLRTLLTMLGMIFGVGAVVAMLSITEGARQEMIRYIDLLGVNNIVVEASEAPDRDTLIEVRQVSPGLTFRDARAIMANTPNIANLSERKTFQPTSLLPSMDGDLPTLIGVLPNYTDIYSMSLIEGRFFTEEEHSRSAPVCVLGERAKISILGYGNAVGKYVKVNEVWLHVIGVTAPQATAESDVEGLEADDRSNVILAPLNSVMRRFEDNNSYLKDEIDGIYIRVEANADPIETSQIVRAILNTTHNGASDFSVLVPADLLAQREQQQLVFQIVMICIAGISLLVGGIGIMNIMLVSVTERTREIGLRMAVGAKGRDVLLQFLVEAIVLSLAGGLVGVGLGFGLSEGLTRFLAWPTAIPPDAVAIAVSFAAGTGIFFGFYPARKAAQLDPIESLRFE